jgi:glycerol-3-phosphate dehydrogenase
VNKQFNSNFDIIIIGGGATGLGCAVEAASRGYKTLLLEAYDYGKGTSSKSTKLVHGGIRYLANFDFALVKEGLEERYYFLKNAPHLAQQQSYLIPLENFIDRCKYWCGISLYDWLARDKKLSHSRFLSAQQTFSEAPNFSTTKVKGGAIYYDGQFDDCRLLISLVRTFEQLGGVALNYHQVTEFIQTDNQLSGVKVFDKLNNCQVNFHAKHIINATGTFSDSLLNLANPHKQHKTVSAAQGTHLVFDRKVFASKHAILVPKTSDNRVLFILPWHDKIVVGTTDIKVEQPSLEPHAQQQEIDFILETLNSYIDKPVTRNDIKSIFCGQRPLVKPANQTNTAKISRKHELMYSENGLVTIVGGKWTIYRRMGEDTINFIENKFNLAKTTSQSKDLAIFGATTEKLSYPLSVYGNQASQLQLLQKQLNNYELLHTHLPYWQVEVIYQIRYEQARTIEDVLARRTRALFLDSKAALECAPIVAKLMAQELNQNQDWQDQQLEQFKLVAKNFMLD